MSFNPWSIVTDLFSSGVGYFKEKNQIKAAVQKRSDDLKKLKLKATLKSIKKSEEVDLRLDENSRQTAGWMDDVSFFIFLVPVILAFFPSMVPHVVNGFEAISNMPEWYQYALGMMLVSVWGYRKLVSPIIQSVAKAYLGK